MSLHSSTHFDPILVADIGGTNARFALITGFDESSNQFTIEHNHIDILNSIRELSLLVRLSV